MVSSLATYYNQNSHKGYGKRLAVKGVAVHCMAGNMTAKRCADYFKGRKDGIGSNYCIGSDGSIACSSAEEYAPFCTSSATVDKNCISIEVANDGGAPDWHMSAQALNSLALLIADIFKRYGIKKAIFLNDKTKRTDFAKQNITLHRWFAAKACPGNYCISMLPAVCNNINVLLGATIQPVSTPAPQPVKPTNKKSVDDIAREVIAGKWGNGASRRAKLTAAGYNYNTIQGRVNELLRKGQTMDWVTAVSTVGLSYRFILNRCILYQVYI